MRFLVEERQARTLRDVLSAAAQVRARAAEAGLPALLVVPHLSDDALELLQREGVNGLDHAGNGTIDIPGRWHFFQRGFPSLAPRRSRPRAPYRGTSALVSRALLACPAYRSVGEVKAEIEQRGGSISLGQVSKVLRALEEDLLIRKDAGGIVLLQPARLLDGLVREYRPPEPLETLDVRAPRDASFLSTLRERAAESGLWLVGYDPQRYVVAPSSQQRLDVYVGPGDGLRLDLAESLGLEPAPHFTNLRVQVVDGRSGYGLLFDAREEEGAWWCSPLEVYLRLMQGGKREKEAAGPLRDDLLAGVSPGP